MAALAEQVERDGGPVLAIYREPVGDHWQIFCLLPLDEGRADAVPARPLAHPRQAAAGGGQEDRPLRGPDRGHVAPARASTGRPTATTAAPSSRSSRPRSVPAILVPEPEVAFQILALNTEKAHNLKEKSLEVIRMYRGLVEERAATGEEDYAFQFESPHFITLGPALRAEQALRGRRLRADPAARGQVPQGPLPEDARGARGARRAGARRPTRRSAAVVAQIKKRGHQPPVREELRPRPHHAAHARSARRCPSFEQTFKKLVDNIEGFDVAKVRYEDIQRSAIMAAPAAG